MGVSALTPYLDIALMLLAYSVITVVVVVCITSVKTLFKPEPWEDGSDRVVAAMLTVVMLAGFALMSNLVIVGTESFIATYFM